MFEYVFSNANNISNGIHKIKGDSKITNVVIASCLTHEAATIIGSLNNDGSTKTLSLNVEESNQKHAQFIVNQIKVSTVFMHVVINCSSVEVLNNVEPIFNDLKKAFPRRIEFMLDGIVVNPGKHVRNFIVFNHIAKQGLTAMLEEHHSIDQLTMTVKPQMVETKMPSFETLYKEFTLFPRVEELSQPANSYHLSPRI